MYSSCTNDIQFQKYTTYRKFAKITFMNRNQYILYFSFIKRIWISQFQQDMIVNAEHIKLLVNLENWNIFKFCYQYNWSVTIATFFEVHMVHLLRLSFDLFHLIPSVKNLIWAKYFGQNIYISQNCLKKYTYKLRSSIFLLYQSLVIILW